MVCYVFICENGKAVDLRYKIRYILFTKRPNEDIMLLKVKVIICPLFEVTEILPPVNISNVSSETAGPIEANITWRLPGLGEMEVSSQGLGHMTNMAPLPIYA